MKAIVRRAYGTVDELEIKEVNIPEASDDEVLVRVMAFGINRAEIYMREGLWGDVAAISGIECVGTVAGDAGGTLEVGQKVAAVMGGMGRTINGSYAEYTCVPRNNVILLDTNLPWAELAAIPESYATAWACLYENLHIDSGKSLVVRGGTSALGQAAINIAAAEGVEVIASTRNKDRAVFLNSIGAREIIFEEPDLSERVREVFPTGVDAVMDIVGNTTLLDSLKMLRKGATVCCAGFLGGGEPIPFSPLTDMPPGVNLNFFASFMLGTPGFLLSTIPMQTIVDNAAKNIYKCKPARIFNFDEIREAHECMESNEACGKIVVTL